VPALRLPDPPLGDGRIVLRPWRGRDAPALAAAARDPEIARFTYWPASLTPREARARIGRARRERARGTRLELAVVDATDDALIGFVGLAPDWTERKAAVFYWTAAPARRRGVASAAVALLSRWALATLGLQRLELLADADNAASRRVAERCGYVREGTLRSYIDRPSDGARPDVVVYSLLPADPAAGIAARRGEA